MKRALLLLVVLSAVLLSSCAATLQLSWTMPNVDQIGGTCQTPQTIPTVGGLVRAVVVWSGPASGRDTVIQAPGTPVTFSKSGLPSGLYSVSVTAVDSLGNASCPATIQSLLRSPFGQVTGLR